MANADLKKTLDHILGAIDKSRGEAGKGSKTARQTIQEDPTAQFFILHEPTIYEEIDSIGFDPHLIKANGGALPILSKADKKRVLDAFEVGYLKNAYKRTNYPKTAKGISTRGRFERHLETLRAQYSGNEFRVYIVGKYSTVRKNKKELFVRELEKVWKELGASKASYSEMAERAGGASPKGGGKADIGFQLGHGEYGIASSEITGARGESQLQKEKRASGALGRSGAKATKSKVKELDDIFTKYRSNFNAEIKHNNIVTQKGELRKDFFIVLSFQKSASNQADAAEVEAIALNTLVDDLKTLRKLVEGDTSIPLRDCLTSVLSEALTAKTRKALATKGIKVRYRGHKPKRRIKQRGKGRTKGSFEFGGKVKTTSGSSLKKLGVVAAVNVNKLNKKTAAAGSKRKLTSPIATLNYINKNIAEELKNNMQSPGLVNRTGRFAESVRALKIIPAKGRNWPVMQYTYDRDPYGVYEVGGGDRRWASKARDPRTVIGKTLREMAREQALSRFTTQRI